MAAIFFYGKEENTDKLEVDMSKKIVIILIVLVLCAGGAAGGYFFWNHMQKEKKFEHDINILFDYKLGMNASRIKSKLHDDFDAESIATINSDAIGKFYRVEIQDFCGYEGLTAKLIIVLDKKDEKIAEMVISIDGDEKYNDIKDEFIILMKEKCGEGNKVYEGEYKEGNGMMGLCAYRTGDEDTDLVYSTSYSSTSIFMSCRLKKDFYKEFGNMFN